MKVKIIGKEWKNLLLIAAIVLALNLPFIAKPMHLDDPLWIYTARWILKDPAHPYSYNREWPSQKGIATSLEDPPLISYYIALVIALFGEREAALHISFMIFPLIAAISMYYLGKKFTRNPLNPALCLATSVVFVVMSNHIMQDIPVLSFIILSLALFIYGVDCGKLSLLFLGSFFASVAFLVKYNAIIIFPLMAVYAIIKKRQRYILFLLIPFSIILLWNFYTYKVYGIAHNVLISNIRIKHWGVFSPMMFLPKAITNLTYIGGALIFPPMFLYPFLKKGGKRRHKIAYATMVIAALAVSTILYFISSNFVYRYSIMQLALFAFFLSTGAFLLYIIFEYALTASIASFSSKGIFAFFDRSYSDIIFLFLWLIGGIVFNIFIGGGAARFIVIYIPPLLLLFFNSIDGFRYLGAKQLASFVFACVVVSSLLSVLVAYSDYQMAGANLDFSMFVGRYKIYGNNIWMVGHDGGSFKYYMLKEGYDTLGLYDAYPIEYDSAAQNNSIHTASDARIGDIVVKAKMQSPPEFTPGLKHRLDLVEIKRYYSSFPFRIHNAQAHAGFYGYGAGFLPYSFSDSSIEDFYIYRVVR